MKISEVYFIHPTQSPDNSSVQSIREIPRSKDPEDRRWLSITKEADAIVVRGCLPGNIYSATPTDFVRYYNWATVSWFVPAVETAAKPSK